jgi:hypothetical protein
VSPSVALEHWSIYDHGAENALPWSYGGLLWSYVTPPGIQGGTPCSNEENTWLSIDLTI